MFNCSTEDTMRMKARIPRYFNLRELSILETFPTYLNVVVDHLDLASNDRRS